MDKPRDLIIKCFLLITLLSASFMGMSQLRINSPYSRFGMGDVSQNTSAYYSSMGNIRYSLPSKYRVNRSNAASYFAVDSASFLFDVGFRGSLIENSTEYSSSQSNYVNLDYLKMAFPVTQWMRTSIGLMPYTMVGYNALITDQMDSVGTVEYSISGNELMRLELIPPNR